ncbi:MAG: ATP-binding protein [Rhizomicrobium sp.]
MGYAFLWSLYPQDFSKTILKVTTALCAAFALAPLFVSLRLLYQIGDISYVPVSGLILYSLYRVTVATWKNRPGAIFTLAGFAFLGAAGISDMLYDQQMWTVGHMMPFGMFAFALSQAFYLSHRYARNLTRIESLSVELDEKNSALQSKMAETEVLSRQIVHVSEDERRRISQDLHDGICQQLTAARLRFSVLKKQMLHTDIDKAELGELSSLLEGAVNQAYDLSLGLWPVDTGIARLAASLEEMCRRSSRAGGFDVAFHSSLTACARQSPESTKHLYRIAQEALANVVKHAQAEHVRVSVACSPRDGIRLTVEDDGIGRAAAASKHGAGLGMPIMNHRAVIIGGVFSVEDRFGGGTIVSCAVPCAGDENDMACRFGKEPLHA